MENSGMKLPVFLAHNARHDPSKDDILQAVWGEGGHSEEVLTEIAMRNFAKSSNQFSQLQ